MPGKDAERSFHGVGLSWRCQCSDGNCCSGDCCADHGLAGEGFPVALEFIVGHGDGGANQPLAAASAHVERITRLSHVAGGYMSWIALLAAVTAREGSYGGQVATFRVKCFVVERKVDARP